MTKQNKIPFVSSDFVSERFADGAPLTSLLAAMQSDDPQRVRRGGDAVQATLKQVASVLTMMSDLVMWERTIEDARRYQLCEGMNLMASLSDICADAMTQIENGWYVAADPENAGKVYDLKNEGGGHETK